MLAEGPRSKGGKVDGRVLLRTLLLITILLSGLTGAVPAYAFELFGFKFFEPEDDQSDVVDPLRYTLTFDVAGGDEDVTDKLRDASAMVADEEKPVSGSLGLLAKATSERDLLVAELYRLAR